MVEALERHLKDQDLATKDLVNLAKLWLEWCYGKPGTQAEEEARVPVDLAKLPPAERVAALERRAEDLRELAEREARGIQ